MSLSLNNRINSYFDSLLLSIKNDYLAAIGDANDESINWTNVKARINRFHRRTTKLIDTKFRWSNKVWNIIAELDAFMDSCWNEKVWIEFYSKNPMMSIAEIIEKKPVEYDDFLKNNF